MLWQGGKGKMLDGMEKTGTNFVKMIEEEAQVPEDVPDEEEEEPDEEEPDEEEEEADEDAVDGWMILNLWLGSLKILLNWSWMSLK